MTLAARTLSTALRKTPVLIAAAGALAIGALTRVTWATQPDYSRVLPAPRVLSDPKLWTMLFAGAIAVWIVQAVQFSELGTTLAFRISRLQYRLTRARESVLVLATMFGLTAMTAAGSVILAPDLSTQWPALRWLQAAAAAALFFRQGRQLAGALLLALFAAAAWEHGPLPVLGHVLFLGIGIYFVAPGIGQERRVAALRLSAAMSMLWIAARNWAVPGPMLQLAAEHPVVMLGMTRPQLVELAGVVQCALGFGLLWRGLYSTAAALLLAAAIVAAVAQSGLSDLAGQAAPLGVLLMLAAERVPTRMYGRRNDAGSVAVTFLLSALAAVLTFYALVYARIGG